MVFCNQLSLLQLTTVVYQGMFLRISMYLHLLSVKSSPIVCVAALAAKVDAVNDCSQLTEPMSSAVSDVLITLKALNDKG